MTHKTRKPKKRTLDIQALVYELKSENSPRRRQNEIAFDLHGRFKKIAGKLVNKYDANPLSREELIDSAMEGFYTALKQYDPDHDSQRYFYSYAYERMRNTLLETVIKHYRLTSDGEKYLFYNEGSFRRAAMEKYQGFEPDDIDRVVAKRLYEARRKTSGKKIVSNFAVACSNVESFKEKIRLGRQNIASLDRAVSAKDGDEDNNDPTPLISCIADENSPDGFTELFGGETDDLIHNALITACSKLEEREKDILLSRRLNSKTLDELGQEYDISKERVRQIEEKSAKFVRGEIALHCFSKRIRHVGGVEVENGLGDIKKLTKGRHRKAIQELSPLFDDLSKQVVASLADLQDLPDITVEPYETNTKIQENTALEMA